MIVYNSFAQNFVWEMNFFHVDTTYNDSASANAVAVDAFGNVYSTGFFVKATDFDPGFGNFILADSFGNPQIYISKLDASGNFLWAKSMGRGSGGHSFLVVDNSNDLFLVENNRWSGGIIISKVDPSGNIVWTKTIFAYLGYKSKPIAIDEFGNIYVSGFFSGTVDFDPGIGIANLTATAQDVFLLKLDNLGSFIWVKQFSTGGAQGPSSVGVDSVGGIYLAGSFNGTTDFDPNAGVNNISSSGLSDIFVTKLNLSGTFIWAKSIGGANTDVLTSIVIDKYENIYSTGYFKGISDFNPGSGVNNLSSTIGSNDIFICKLDSSGNYKWAKSFSGVYDDYSYSLAVDINENVFTTGNYKGTVDFNPNAGVFNLSSLSSTNDIFVSKLDSAGNFVNALTFPGTGWESGFCITTDNYDNIFLTGDHVGGITDFDPGSGVYSVNAIQDAALFVLKLGNNVSAVNEMPNNLDNLAIYPNPANESINVVVNSKLVNSKYLIINALGQIISSGKLPTENTSINIDGLPTGIYLFQVGTLNQHSYRIVKK